MTPAELTAAREILHLSQVELAERLGVHPTMVNRWERGRAKTTPYLRIAIAKLIDDHDSLVDTDHALHARDLEIEQLRVEVLQLQRERNIWETRARTAEGRLEYSDVLMTGNAYSIRDLSEPPNANH